MKRKILLSFVVALLVCLGYSGSQAQLQRLEVSQNKRYFQTSDGNPFFWLGDTGWLLFIKCNREETIHYLDTRQKQGFNVVQVMVLHSLGAKNVYGASALKNNNAGTPNVTPGNDPNNKDQYDYWDHMDFVIDEAEKRGIYIALVAVWGGNVKSGHVSVAQATAYAKFLAQRFGKHNNIIWVDGGDIPGNEGMAVWKAIGNTIKKYDANHLETFHPRGRYISSDWFHNEKWLDFNMFQSGHRTYAQDTSMKEKYRFGEDNWKYVNVAYNLKPTKPVLDGEPSYENIPHGLHDSLQARWSPAEVRRYAYWSVFAGAAGFTYGENAIMQFHTMGKVGGAYGVTGSWKETINAPGAQQMHFLKDLVLSKSYFDRKPAQEIIVDNGKRYNNILATKGNDYAMAYTYTGRTFKVNTAKLGFEVGKASWFHPTDGATTPIDLTNTKGIVSFDPPGEPKEGNDWVLVLEK